MEEVDFALCSTSLLKYGTTQKCKVGKPVFSPVRTLASTLLLVQIWEYSRLSKTSLLLSNNFREVCKITWENTGGGEEKEKAERERERESYPSREKNLSRDTTICSFVKSTPALAEEELVWRRPPSLRADFKVRFNMISHILPIKTFIFTFREKNVSLNPVF